MIHPISQNRRGHIEQVVITNLVLHRTLYQQVPGAFSFPAPVAMGGESGQARQGPYLQRPTAAAMLLKVKLCWILVVAVLFVDAANKDQLLRELLSRVAYLVL